MSEISNPVKNIIKSIKKELNIPSTLPEKWYALIDKANKYLAKNVTVFITVSSTGVILELMKKPGPFVLGELLYSENLAKRNMEKKDTDIKRKKLTEDDKNFIINNNELITESMKKKMKRLALVGKPCPPNKVRD